MSENEKVILGDIFARVETLRLNAYEAEHGTNFRWPPDRQERELFKIKRLLENLITDRERRELAENGVPEGTRTES